MKRSRLSKSGSRKKTSRMKKNSKYIYDGFSRATNKKGQVVGYVGTLTWTGKKPKIAKGMKEYLISFWIERRGEEPYVEDISVHAVDLEAMKTALGFYSSYSREWGDYRGIIEAIENKTANITIRHTTLKDVDY
jgi:hypothetical protein